MPWSPDAQKPRCPDAEKPRCREAQKPRWPDAQKSRCPDAQMPRNPDAQKFRCPDAQMPRSPDAQMPRSQDAQMPRYLDVHPGPPCSIVFRIENTSKDALYKKFSPVPLLFSVPLFCIPLFIFFLNFIYLKMKIAHFNMFYPIFNFELKIFVIIENMYNKNYFRRDFFLSFNSFSLLLILLCYKSLNYV